MKIKMKIAQRNHWLFGVALKTAKYALFFFFGMVIFCLISLIFSANIVAELLIAFLLEWIWRVAIVIFCLFVVGVLVESLR